MPTIHCIPNNHTIHETPTIHSNSLDHFPLELIRHIFSFLKDKNDCAVLQVNRAWYAIGLECLFPAIISEREWKPFFCTLIKCQLVSRYLNANCNLFEWESAKPHLHEVLNLAIENQSFYSIQGLIQAKHTPLSILVNILYWSAQNGEVSTMLNLLKDERIVSNGTIQNCFNQAVLNGQIECVAKLLEDTRIDPSAQDQQAIGDACRYGHSEIVRLLLQQDCIDPSTHHQYCIFKASQYGHLDVVRQLMQDRRVDPSAEFNRAYHTAFANQHYKVANQLFKDQRVKYAFYGWCCCRPQQDD